MDQKLRDKGMVSISARGNFFGGIEVPRGRAGKGDCRVRRPGAEEDVLGFSKIFKKTMKILQFFDNFNGKFCNFFKFFKISSNFS